MNEVFNDYISQGVALMSTNKYDGAKEMFAKAIESDRNAIDGYIHFGNACASLNQLDEALESFKKALIINKESGEVLYSIGNIYLLKDEKLKAVEYYNKAEEAGFKSAEMYQILAGIFYGANDVEQALRNINKAILASPFDGELRLSKVQLYISEEKYNEALETLDEMEKILPDSFEVYDLKAQIYSNLGKLEDALQTCNLACERFPEDINLAFSKLKVLVVMEKDDEALVLLNEMKNHDEFELILEDVVIQEAIIYLRKNDIEKATILLEDANSKLGGNAELLRLLLDIYGRTEQYEKILEKSNELMKMKTNLFYESTAKFFHANSLEKLGKQDEAKIEYKKLTVELRKATINEPGFYEGYIYRLLSHTAIGEYDKAIDLAEYIENLYPDRADSHAFKYFIYKTQGDTSKAEIEKSKAQNINPEMVL